MTSNLPLFGEQTELLRIIEDARKDIRYVITDFSVELLASKFSPNKESDISRLDLGDIYIPQYQRELTWSDDNLSYFMESIILRFPIPPIFLYDVDGSLEVVDGSQRLRCIRMFLNDEFKLTGLDKLEDLNGYHFGELPITVQKRIRNTPIRTFILDNSTDSTTCVELFRRLNTTGKQLSDAEIRKGAFPGPFLDLVIECADSKEFQLLTHSLPSNQDPRGERQELVTRFFIYLDNYLDFRHDVRNFLDRKMIQYNRNLTSSQIERLKLEFFQTMSFIHDHYRTAFYRKTTGRKLARVRFEAISVGTALALRSGPITTTNHIHWLKSTKFNELARTDASNSAPKLRQRIEFVRDNLMGKF